MRIAKFVAMSLVAAALVSVAGRSIASSKRPAATSKYDWLFRYLDRNHNNQIDATDRKKMPSLMRQWLRSNDIADRGSISRERFLEIAPSMMQALRGGKFNSPYRFPRSSFENVHSDHSQRLPARFRSRDVDGDGQIGFYEWNILDAKKFGVLDLNRDGFLTPYELGSRSKKLTVKLPKPSRAATQAYQGRAKIGFRLADRNRDGSVSAEEWGKIRPGSLSDNSSRSMPHFPLSFDEFTRFYIEHSTPAQK